MKSNIAETIAESGIDGQSAALIQVILDLLDSTKRQMKGLLVALIISILVNVAIVGGFLVYESQFDIADTVTETTTLETSGENADINNVEGDQYNDNAARIERLSYGDSESN
jgi:hypothetical protein